MNENAVLEEKSVELFEEWDDLATKVVDINATVLRALTATDKDVNNWFAEIEKAIITFRHLRTTSILHFKRCQRFNDNVKK